MSTVGSVAIARRQYPTDLRPVALAISSAMRSDRDMSGSQPTPAGGSRIRTFVPLVAGSRVVTPLSVRLPARDSGSAADVAFRLLQGSPNIKRSLSEYGKSVPLRGQQLVGLIDDQPMGTGSLDASG